jgi:RimJ/RimL family protein N-acetyltransferase
MTQSRLGRGLPVCMSSLSNERSPYLQRGMASGLCAEPRGAKPALPNRRWRMPERRAPGASGAPGALAPPQGRNASSKRDARALTRYAPGGMQLSFARIGFSEVGDEIRRHLAALPAPIDSFLEDHVRDSNHYAITVRGARVGFASIHKGSLLTQFSLAPAQQRCGQAAFQSLRKLEHVAAAFVPTCDEFYLSHAIDDYRQLLKQAYFFEAQPAGARKGGRHPYSLRPATAADAAAIRQQSGELFGDVDARIERGELFSTERHGACVGFGVMEKSELQPGVASIGMFTLEAFRGTGVGTATIELLIEECSRRGLRAVAGCWYYNHPSKRTLERAGMVSRTRLLRVEY